MWYFLLQASYGVQLCCSSESPHFFHMVFGGFMCFRNADSFVQCQFVIFTDYLPLHFTGGCASISFPCMWYLMIRFVCWSLMLRHSE